MKPLHLGYNAAGSPIRITPEERKTHTHVIGSSGSGKSKFLEWMIRGDLRNRQGFCLIDPHGTLYNDVLNYCSHHVLDRDIILLNLSEPSRIVGFNPFRKSPSGHVSVQVDRRIAATMHAWNVKSTDETPTLERVLRLVYTTMLESELGLPQVRHLIDFNSREIRSNLIADLQTPLIQNEWQELQQLRSVDWRAETLSTRNRLFRLLTSPTLGRFMGIPDRTLDLKEIMDEGKIVLVNLAPSDYLSHEQGRVFGALMVNEFFESALRRRRDDLGGDPKPYYLYLDEFQNFVSLDLTDMLDQVRKFGLFLVMAHQRFGQVDGNLIDAVLTNCRIRAVFGGLPAESARLMAEEMFIGELDPKKIKAAIYQTKFWPEYRRDKVYTSGTSRSSGSSSGQSSGAGSGFNTTSGEFFQPTDWFGSPLSAGTSAGDSRSSFSFSGSGRSTSESLGDSESVADIPIFVPVPFEELSSLQYSSSEEQLLELTAALKEQYERHCFLKVKNEATQPMLVPFVRKYFTSRANLENYSSRLLSSRDALEAPEIDRLIEARETALLKSAQTQTSTPQSKAAPQEPLTKRTGRRSARSSLFSNLHATPNPPKKIQS